MIPLKTAAAEQNANQSAKTSSIWSRMLGEKKEQGKEKPALS